MNTESHRPNSRLWFVLFVLGILLMFRLLVPYLAEQIQYSLTRGKERAELDAARQGLQPDGLSLTQLSKASELVAKRVAPSVVHLNVLSVAPAAPTDELAFLYGERLRATQGQGSGVIIDAAGYVLTNYHVVRGAAEIEASLSDGRRVRGNVVGADPLTDLAVVRIQAADLIAADWGDSDELEVGSLVWAIGSPFGLQRSITMGILSAKNRSSGGAGNAFQDFLQTDAAVNPGNSGGPLVNAAGQVVGINTAIVGEAFQGISFAIPSGVARTVYEQLRSGRQVLRGWLGVRLQDVDERLASELGLAVASGALVVEVVNIGPAKSPAGVAGIRPGDVVTSWNGVAIGDSASLSQHVARTPIGDAVPVVVNRNGRELTLEVTVSARPAELN